MEAGSLRKGMKVAVAGDEGKLRVQTELRDEGVAQAGAASLGKHLGAESSGTLPKAELEFDQRQIIKTSGDGRREMGVAEKFGKDDGKHGQLALLQGLL